MEDGLKISELTQTTTINDSDLIPIVQNDETKSITKEDLVADTQALIDRNSTYSTTEKIIGTWVNNKPIYRKVVDFGSLPNANLKNVAHNINNLDFVVSAWAVAKRTDDNGATYFPINQARSDAFQNSISLYLTQTNISIQTGIDRSNTHITYVVIEYTKTTD